MGGSILQRFAWPPGGAEEQLFARLSQGCYFDGGNATGRRLIVGAGGQVSFDTLFNAFFLAPWRRWTALPNIEIEIVHRGDLTVKALWLVGERRQVLRVSETGAHEAVATWRTTLEIPAEADSGRIALELSSRSGAELTSLRFITMDPPVRDVRLSVGVCSFNRPDSVRSLIETLRAEAAPALNTIIIVEQGEPSSSEDGQPQDGRADVAFIRQPNFGGAGGFTRSIMEALVLAEASRDGPTHHVLMDDDAAASPDLITRLAALFAFSRSDIAIGAPMLELETPWRLHEAGVRFEADRRRRSIGRGLDARCASTLGLFDEALVPDAHAWWCWGAPLSAIRRAGAPLNLFIKYDDIEYTHRLFKQGVPTAVLPGAAVWHESFANKFADWRSYYTMRNECVFQVLHEPTEAWAGSPVWDNVWPAILRHDYARARLMIDAIADFLEGPESALPENAVREHDRVMARFKAFRPEQICRPALPSSCKAAPEGSRSDWIALMALLFGGGARQAQFVTETAFEPHPTMVGPQCYARFVPGAERGELLQRNRWKACSLIAAMLQVHLKFKRHARAGRQRWLSRHLTQDAASAQATFDRWQAVFSPPMERTEVPS